MSNILKSVEDLQSKIADKQYKLSELSFSNADLLEENESRPYKFPKAIKILKGTAEKLDTAVAKYNSVGKLQKIFSSEADRELKSAFTEAQKIFLYDKDIKDAQNCGDCKCPSCTKVECIYKGFKGCYDCHDGYKVVVCNDGHLIGEFDNKFATLYDEDREIRFKVTAEITNGEDIFRTLVNTSDPEDKQLLGVIVNQEGEEYYPIEDSEIFQAVINLLSEAGII